MPAQYTFHVALTDPLVRYVRDKVTNGDHPSASDVVRLALGAMMEREGTSGQQTLPSDKIVGQPARG